MKIAIIGSRDYPGDPSLVPPIVEATGWRSQITAVLCGCANGPDTWGRLWAEQNNILVIRFPANWQKYGKKSAGMIRNREMLAEADGVIALWDGTSTGTLDAIKLALRRELIVYLQRPGQPLRIARRKKTKPVPAHQLELINVSEV